jgi:hypothetical protein
MLLSPIGIINERHEPPSFNGVERPFVDKFVIPSTWSGSGGGMEGDLGKGFAYRAYLMTSLDALGFSDEEGFRGGDKTASSRTPGTRPRSAGWSTAVLQG